MQVLLLTQIHLTRAAEALGDGRALDWEILGLDGWIQSPAIAKAAQRFPSLESDFRQDLEAAFSPKGTVQLAHLGAIPEYTLDAYLDRYRDEFPIPYPFECYTSPSASHLHAFELYVQPTLETPLPTDLHGLRVETGEGEPQHFIARDTLLRTNLDELEAGVPEDDDGRPVRAILREVFDFLASAKRNEADVIATSG